MADVKQKFYSTQCFEYTCKQNNIAKNVKKILQMIRNYTRLSVNGLNKREHFK